MTKKNDKLQKTFQNYLVIFLLLNFCVLGNITSVAKIFEN